jgi:hypothetical protein
MRLRRHKTKIIIALAALALFVGSGYLMSDDVFFRRLVRSHQLTTPEEVFAFIGRNTFNPPDDMPAINGLTPRYMLTERKYLYCDEGAILMLTIVQRIGYQTRLVDLIGDDNISHHTILEVLENGAWKTYDTTYRTAGASYEQSARNFRPRPSYRTHPGLYGWVIQRNFYLKHLALWLRRIPG